MKSGIRCLVIDYDLCPDVSVKTITNQVCNFFSWFSVYVLENDVKRVAFAGHSVGAHLLAFGLSEAFLSLVSEIQIDAIFISGIFYCDELRSLKSINPDNILSLDDSNFKELSPLYQTYDFFSRFNIKAHFYVGADESNVFKEHSWKFAGGPMRNYTEILKIVPQCDHFNIIEKFASDEEYEITKLVLEKLSKKQ